MAYIIKKCPAYNEDTLECCGKDTSHICCHGNTSKECHIKKMIETAYERKLLSQEIKEIFNIAEVN